MDRLQRALDRIGSCQSLHHIAAELYIDTSPLGLGGVMGLLLAFDSTRATRGGAAHLGPGHQRIALPANTDDRLRRVAPDAP